MISGAPSSANRRVGSSPATPGSSSSGGINGTTSNSNGSSNKVNDSLHAQKLQREHTAKRIQTLEATIANTTLGIVARTKAKVELALLRNDDDDTLKSKRVEEEIAAVKESSDVSRTTRLVEQNVKTHENRIKNELAIQVHLADLHQLALERQGEARRRAEEARIKTVMAMELLHEAEREAEEAMAKARAAMMKLNEARERAGEERRLLQEAQVAEEKQLQELERLAAVEEDGGDGNGDDEDGGGGEEEEDGDVKMKDSSNDGDQQEEEEGNMLDNQMDALNANFSGEDPDINHWEDACAELSQQIDILEAKQQELQAANKQQQDKIASLENHIEKSGETQSYWKEQSTKLSNQLNDVQSQRIEQELELQVLKMKMSKEDKQVQNLKGEIQDLREMKDILEFKLLSVEEQEKVKLQELMEEVAALLAEKENALETVEAIKQMYEKSIAERESLIDTLQHDVDTHSTELQQAQALIEEKDALATNLRSSMEKLHLQKAQDEQEIQLSQDQARASIEELTSELHQCKEQLGQYHEQVVNLQQIGRDQQHVIEKMTNEKQQARSSIMINQEDEQIQSSLQEQAPHIFTIEESASELKQYQEQVVNLQKIVRDQQHVIEKMTIEKQASSIMDSQEDEEIQPLQEQAPPPHHASIIVELTSELKQYQEQFREYQEQLEYYQEQYANLEQINQDQQHTIENMKKRGSGSISQEEEEDEEEIQSSALQEQALPHNHAAVEELSSEVGNLQKIVRDQQHVIEEMTHDIGKMRKKAMRVDNMKEAFIVQDTEIQRLSALLSTEIGKAEKLSIDVAHWKSSSTDLSKSVCKLEQQRDLMKETAEDAERKLSEQVFRLQKRVFHLQKETVELRKTKDAKIQEASNLRSSLKKQEDEALARTHSRSLSQGSLPDSIFETSVLDKSHGSLDDSDFEAKFENAALKDLLARALAERDRLAVENELLKENSGDSPRKAALSAKVTQSEKEIMALRKKLSELQAEKERLNQELRQLNDTTEKIDTSTQKRYEEKLKSVQSEKAQLVKKLKLLLELSDSKSTLKAITEGPDAEKTTKRSRVQVYQLSCKECKSDLNYIGKTRKDLKCQVHDHFKDVCQMVRSEQKGERSKKEEEDKSDDDFVHSDFAKHFARHCRNAQTQEEILTWCSQNIKVKKQKVQDDENDDCPMPRTVYQLSCKDCKSNLHYIGSTHENLKGKVVKHYNEIWDIVQQEYGEEGFCKDASACSGAVGKFGSSALHFAKHCRHAKSKDDVKAWCKEHVKVEKWTMVCKTCLGTSIDSTSQNKNSIMSFKVESKLDLSSREP